MWGAKLHFKSCKTWSPSVSISWLWLMSNKLFCFLKRKYCFFYLVTSETWIFSYLFSHPTKPLLKLILFTINIISFFLFSFFFSSLRGLHLHNYYSFLCEFNLKTHLYINDLWRINYYMRTYGYFLSLYFLSVIPLCSFYFFLFPILSCCCPFCLFHLSFPLTSLFHLLQIVLHIIRRQWFLSWS